MGRSKGGSNGASAEAYGGSRKRVHFCTHKCQLPDLRRRHVAGVNVGVFGRSMAFLNALGTQPETIYYHIEIGYSAMIVAVARWDFMMLRVQ